MEGTKIVIKCDNPVYADAITERLTENNIASTIHDETQDPAVGSYGGSVGIAIRVYEKDFTRAKAIVEEMENERKKDITWCPSCGSEDVTKIRETEEKTPIGKIIFGLLLTALGTAGGILSLVYPQYNNLTVNVVSFILFIIGITLFSPFQPYKPNYHCNQCGNEFIKK